jgi:hypothetical protein
VDADYYGFRDDEDGKLEELERAAEAAAVEAAVKEWEQATGKRRKLDDEEDNDDELSGANVFRVPSTEAVERALIERRKQVPYPPCPPPSCLKRLVQFLGAVLEYSHNANVVAAAGPAAEVFRRQVRRGPCTPNVSSGGGGGGPSSASQRGKVQRTLPPPHVKRLILHGTTTVTSSLFATTSHHRITMPVMKMKNNINHLFLVCARKVLACVCVCARAARSGGLVKLEE